MRSSMNYRRGVVLLTLAATASPVNELATILFCGTTDQPTPICCQAAREARKQTDKQGRAIIDSVRRQELRQRKRPQPVGPAPIKRSFLISAEFVGLAICGKVRRSPLSLPSLREPLARRVGMPYLSGMVRPP
jgi:hypothetical protein